MEKTSYLYSTTPFALRFEVQRSPRPPRTVAPTLHARSSDFRDIPRTHVSLVCAFCHFATRIALCSGLSNSCAWVLHRRFKRPIGRKPSNALPDEQLSCFLLCQIVLHSRLYWRLAAFYEIKKNSLISSRCKPSLASYSCCWICGTNEASICLMTSAADFWLLEVAFYS